MKSFVMLLRHNWKAGLAVALINIPLSISLAVASLGTGSANAPLLGIITAIWGGAFAAFFASSKQNVYGPAGALSGILIVFSIGNGAQYVPFVAIVAGLMIFLVYLLKLSKYITLIPSTALHGFLMGVGITIASTQLNSAFGLTGLPQHKEYIANLLETFRHLPQIQWSTFVVFALGFGFLMGMKKYVSKIPGALPLTVIGIIVGYLSNRGYLPHLETIGSKFPSLAFHIVSLPSIAFPSIDTLRHTPGKELIGMVSENITLIKAIINTAIVVAIVGILETLISAKIAEKLTKMKFDKDIEVRGLALANVASGIAGGMPATAVLVRTVLNAKSGANHRMSAFLAAVFTLVIAAALFDGFKYLPMPIIAAILMNIAIGLIEIKLYKKILSYDTIAFYTTMLVGIITVVDDPIMGIITGTAISLIIFVKKVSDGNVRIGLFRNGTFGSKVRLRDYLKHQEKDDTIIYRLNGSLTYLNIESQIEQVNRLDAPANIIFSFSNVHNIDIDGLEALDEMFESLLHKNINIHLSGIGEDIKPMLEKMHFYQETLKKGNIADSSSLVIRRLGITTI